MLKDLLITAALAAVLFLVFGIGFGDWTIAANAAIGMLVGRVLVLAVGRLRA